MPTNKKATNIDIGEIYQITLGSHSDKYLVTGNFNGVKELRRVQLPKTKIDAVRLPERISISYFGQSVATKKNKTIEHNRSSKSGKYVTKKFTDKHPNTTVTEHDKL